MKHDAGVIAHRIEGFIIGAEREREAAFSARSFEDLNEETDANAFVADALTALNEVWDAGNEDDMAAINSAVEIVDFWLAERHPTPVVDILATVRDLFPGADVDCHVGSVAVEWGDGWLVVSEEDLIAIGIYTPEAWTQTGDDPVVLIETKNADVALGIVHLLTEMSCNGWLARATAVAGPIAAAMLDEENAAYEGR